MVQIFAWLISCAYALKYSERRAFHCRIDAEHNTSPTARLSAADPSQCNVSVEEVGRFFIITSNGLPDHEVHSKKIKSQNIEISIPKVPTIMEEPECAGNGIVGIAKNGVPIYNSVGADCCDLALKNLHRVDECNGWADSQGVYRYHIYPTCLASCEFGTESDIVGVALDGFPIYGPIDDNGQQLTSADLDECHGKWHGNEYRYHVTADFPYFISCFRGRVPSQNKQGLSSDRYRGRRSESDNRERRSFSWKEGARMPGYSSYTQVKPVKMGDCRVCRSVSHCQDDKPKNSYSDWSGASSLNRYVHTTRAPLVTRPPPTRAPSVQIKQIERQRPMTRTLSRDPIFTPKRQPQPQRSLFSLYNPAPRTEAPTPAPPLTTRRQTHLGNFEPQLKSANRFSSFNRFAQNTPTPTQKANHYHAIPTPQQYIYTTQATTTTAAPTALPRFNSLYSRLRELKAVGSLSSPNPKRFAGVNLDAELEKMRTENLKLAKPTFGDLSVSDLTQILEDTKVKKDPLVALLEGSEENLSPGQFGRGQFGLGQFGGRYGSNNARRWSNSQVPENLQRDADRYLKKSYFGKRKRRSLSSWSTSSPSRPSGGDFFNQLTSVYESRNLRTSFYEVGFLTKNEGRVHLKCQPARYRTQMPDTKDDLNPRLLAQILEERKFPKSVKRSRFASYFQG